MRQYAVFATGYFPTPRQVAHPATPLNQAAPYQVCKELLKRAQFQAAIDKYHALKGNQGKLPKHYIEYEYSIVEVLENEG